jgi:hypothetical protein
VCFLINKYTYIYIYKDIHRLCLYVCNACFLIDKYTHLSLHIDYMNYMYNVCIYLQVYI